LLDGLGDGYRNTLDCCWIKSAAVFSEAVAVALTFPQGVKFFWSAVWWPVVTGGEELELVIYPVSVNA
jgi:hypothetical protein